MIYSEPRRQTMQDRIDMVNALLRTIPHAVIDTVAVGRFALVQRAHPEGLGHPLRLVLTDDRIIPTWTESPADPDVRYQTEFAVDLDTGERLAPVTVTRLEHEPSPSCIGCGRGHEDPAYVDWCDRHDRCVVSAECRSSVVLHTRAEPEPA